MRKLTALTVALSLSAAGQAFAGEPHATHAAPPHVVAPVKEILEAKQNGQQAKQIVLQQAEQQAKATSQASSSHAPTGQADTDADLTADLVKATEASRNYKANSGVVSEAHEMVDTLLQSTTP
jgi:hypothetical protein